MRCNGLIRQTSSNFMIMGSFTSKLDGGAAGIGVAAGAGVCWIVGVGAGEVGGGPTTG